MPRLLPNGQFRLQTLSGIQPDGLRLRVRTDSNRYRYRDVGSAVRMATGGVTLTGGIPSCYPHLGRGNAVGYAQMQILASKTISTPLPCYRWFIRRRLGCPGLERIIVMLYDDFCFMFKKFPSLGQNASIGKSPDQIPHNPQDCFFGLQEHIHVPCRSVVYCYMRLWISYSKIKSGGFGSGTIFGFGQRPCYVWQIAVICKATRYEKNRSILWKYWLLPTSLQRL